MCKTPTGKTVLNHQNKNGDDGRSFLDFLLTNRMLYELDDLTTPRMNNPKGMKQIMPMISTTITSINDVDTPVRLGWISM